ncbi:MAG: tripartite tricarboxylate transporter permease [Lachnospiraceae bacterium]|nr:tripartite tricarboxylate transporter permease [Lachnospiraceae bacterium]
MLGTVASDLFTWQNILFMNLGLFAGIIIGALPGLTATLGVALLMPMTFGMKMVPGIVLLLGVYCGGIYGGSITAILIKTPGTPASAATALDGYPLAQQGRSGYALDAALKASTFGGIFSAFVLIFVAPQVARFALTFSAVEYFALSLFGLTIISSISGKNQVKGLISGMLGLLVSCIGIDPINGTSRFVFRTELLAGIDVIPAMIGLFAITEIINKSRSVFRDAGVMQAFSSKGIPAGEFWSKIGNLIRSSAIGTFIGAVPGTGATTASFLAYNEAKRVSKSKETFGTGNIDGLMASEAANNGVTGATLIPLLTLGIPGDTVTAILLGAFMMQGVTPGPLLIKNNPETIYTIMCSLLVVNIFMLLQGKFFVRIFANVTRIPVALLIPLLVNLCMLGSYAGNNSVFDVKLSIIFGIIGYILILLDVPLTPMVIAMVLGDICENNLRRGVAMASGSYMIFYKRPISLVLIIISAISLLYPMMRTLIEDMRAKKSRSEEKSE